MNTLTPAFGSRKSSITIMSSIKRPQILRVNLRGQEFDIPYTCLQRAPTSRLANLLTSPLDAGVRHDVSVQEVIFDRSPIIFQSVHNFYLDGHLHLPPNTCITAVSQELDFWGLEAEMMAPCCWDMFAEAKDKEASLTKIRAEFTGCQAADSFVHDTLAQLTLTPLRRKLSQFWVFLEFPNSSPGAKIWSISFICIIFISVVVLCLDTVAEWRVTDSQTAAELANMTSEVTFTRLSKTSSHPAIQTCELITLTLLTAEALIRAVTSPLWSLVLKCPYMWVTLTVLLPSWMVLLTDYITHGHKDRVGPHFTYFYMFCFCLRTLRLVCFGRMVRHFQGLYILIMSLRASKRELLLLILLLFLGVSLYGNIIFFVELKYDNLTNVAQGFWWALITMTTVGYGDTYPVSVIGCMVGSLCAVTGIIILALPIPVIANNFNLYYSCATIIERQRKHEVALYKFRCQQSLMEKETQTQVPGGGKANPKQNDGLSKNVE